MAFSAPLSHVVLVITAAVLFYVALTDFKQFKIRNEVILVLAGLFVVHATAFEAGAFASCNSDGP